MGGHDRRVDNRTRRGFRDARAQPRIGPPTGGASAMRQLILVKHAPPLIDPAKSPERWRLSEKGRALCAPLAERLATYAPKIIVSSIEPKAVETAELVAATLKVPHETAADLHEHDRSNVPHLRSGEFISMVEVFFRNPAELILGRESAKEAL